MCWGRAKGRQERHNGVDPAGDECSDDDSENTVSTEPSDNDSESPRQKAASTNPTRGVVNGYPGVSGIGTFLSG